MSTRADAQARIDRIRLFRQELEQLQSEGVLRLDEAQNRAVEAHHQRLQGELKQSFDIDADARAKQLSLGMRIASFLGALSLAASVFFFFYRFWGRIEVTAQVSILLAAPVLSLAFTAWLRARDFAGYFTRLAAMVSFACWWWEIMPKYLFFLVVGLTAVLFLLVLRRLRGIRVQATA